MAVRCIMKRLIRLAAARDICILARSPEKMAAASTLTILM